MKAGWLSILRSEKQLMADTKNVNNISHIRTALHSQMNRKQHSQKHKECAPARMCKDEQAIQDLISCFKEFDCFPFDPASPALRTLQSAISATPELIQDFKKAKQDGEAQLKKFMDERIYSKEKSIHDHIKQNSRKTKFAAHLCKDFIKKSLWRGTKNGTRRNGKQGASIRCQPR
jgi:hypothetical protein